ncbi:MAG TPA: TIGR03013 family XrtA/PEP-CTERM system glycosyltransferase [Blastocatellia bacterium]|nr:TIGR03013 family XrtA/PEP-CTERM system glycosyltransferase [Blastocatellia bacterium]
MLSRNHSRTLSLLILESILTCCCGIVAVYVRFGSEAPEVLVAGRGLLKILLMIVVTQASFYLLDLYDFSEIRKPGVLYVRTLQALGLASIVMAVIFYTYPQMLFGRGVFLISLLFMLSTMILWRVFVMWLLGHPRLAERVLILGTERNAIDLAREALDRPEQGYKIVGFVGDDPQLVGQSLINPRVLGLTDDLQQIVNRYHINRIVLAINERRGRMPLGSLIEMKLRDGLAIEESDSFYERLTGKVSTGTLRPSWLIFSGPSRRMIFYRQLRRLLDVLLSVVGLVLSLPIMMFTAVAIRLDSRGPILYRQTRVGQRNRTFTIMKFRSMRIDAEPGGPVWAEEDDPRVTRVGRVIRKLRIDELPQFINIIRGEMTFVGPRPERPEFVSRLEREIPYYSQRHLVKPGLTGWAQVRYPYCASVEDAIQKLQYDLYYIKNQSLLLDVITLFETVRIVLFGRGAR